MIEKRARARKTQAEKGRAAGAGKALRFGPALMARLDALAAFTEVPGQLTRRYLTPAHVAAMGQVRAWMEEAGMQVRVDAVCNVIGRYEAQDGRARPPSCSARTSTPWWMPASTTATSACWPPSPRWRTWASRGERLDHAIEVVAFGEEEGVRFPTHLLTSSALVGTLEPAHLRCLRRRRRQRARGAGRRRRQRRCLSQLRAQEGRHRRLSGAAYRAGAGAVRQGPCVRGRHGDQWRHPPDRRLCAGLPATQARCRWAFAAMRWRRPPR